MRDCDKCGGTGKQKTLAVVGPVPSFEAAIAALADMAPGDIVVTSSDFVQAAAVEAGRRCMRERIATDADIAKAADTVVDFTPKAESPAPAAEAPPESDEQSRMSARRPRSKSGE